MMMNNGDTFVKMKPSPCIPVMIFASFLAKSPQIVIGESMALPRGAIFEISQNASAHGPATANTALYSSVSYHYVTQILFWATSAVYGPHGCKP